MPVLAFILCLGAPAIYPERPLDYSPPTKVLDEGILMPFHITGIRALFLTIVEYILAAAAVGNVWHNTYQLSMNTVFIPVCNQSWWILCWNALPVIIHCIAATGYNTKLMQLSKSRSDGARSAAVNNPYNGGQQAASSSDLLSTSSNPMKKPSFLDKIADRKAKYVPHEAIPKWLKVVNSCATFLAFLHSIVGVLVFSSLGFICVGDAIGVMSRYVASAAVIKLLLVLEFSRMRRGWAERMKKEKPEYVQSDGIETQQAVTEQGDVDKNQIQTAYEGYKVTEVRRERGNL
jgi:hypothetical protein